MTVDPVATLEELNGLANELDELSKNLAEVERRLVPVQSEYEDSFGAFEEGLWQQHVELGAKFPAEALRQRLFHRSMDPEKLGRYVGLMAQRKRMQQRESSLKASIGAKRSILSALKEDASITQTSLRRERAGA